MSHVAMITAYFVLAIFCFISAVSMHRYKKGLNRVEQNRFSQSTYPWWYYVGGIISLILILGSFKNETKLIGYILFLLILGLGWKWKLKQK
jgi:uncharacterized membrane protein YdcZ (DUF606 family)